MNFNINSKDLEKLLTKIFPAVPVRTPMPLLSNFLFELKDGKLTIYATDLEIYLKSSVPVSAEGEFKGLLPARRFYDLIRSLKDSDIRFEIEADNVIYLVTPGGHYKFNYLPSDEYPKIPKFPDDENDAELKEIVIKGEDLKYSLEKTVFAISKEEVRPAMMGLLLEFEEEGLRFVATDGHRLVNLLNKNIKHDLTEQYIVPEKAVSILTKLVEEKDVKIFINSAHISFQTDNLELISRLVNYKYPDYKAVIPYENEYELLVNREELLNSLRRMLLFAITKIRKVTFNITEDKLEISAEDIDSGANARETLECVYNGMPVELSFNAAFLSDLLVHMSEQEKVLFKLHNESKAVLLLPGEKQENLDLLMLMMPIRAN